MSSHRPPIHPVGSVASTGLSGLDVAALQAEVAGLGAELARLRRELDESRAVLSWIDSLQALDGLGGGRA